MPTAAAAGLLCAVHGIPSFALPFASELTAARSQMAFTLGFHVILAARPPWPPSRRTRSLPHDGA